MAGLVPAIHLPRIKRGAVTIEKSGCRLRQIVCLGGIEQFAHLAREVLLGERLVQEMHVGVESPLMHDGIARIAGREQDRQARAEPQAYFAPTAVAPSEPLTAAGRAALSAPLPVALSPAAAFRRWPSTASDGQQSTLSRLAYW